MAKRYLITVRLLCLVTLVVFATGVRAKQEEWPCGGHSKLLRDNRGKPIWLKSDELKKRATHHVAPRLPSSVRAEGTIIVELLMDTEGNVQCVRASNGHPLLRRAAEEAAKQWKFKPVVVDGEIVAVFGRLAFRFSA